MQRSAEPDLANAIAASITALPAIARLGAGPMPGRATAERLLALMREVAFPGFHAPPHAPAHADAASFVAERLPALMAAAVDAIETSSRATGAAIDAKAAASALLARIPAIREALARDVQSAFDGDPAARSVVEVVACYPGIAALAAHRFAHELWVLGVPILPRLLAEVAHSETGIDIHPGARIGAGTFIDHGTGVVIGETCEIGPGCRIYQGVTLGARKFERGADGALIKGTKRHPTLEAGVTVYAGATILGGDTVIGAGAVVAGGVFVTSSVPAGHLVAGPKTQVRVMPHGGELS
jgi:serine O-acetyltransferase